MKLFKRLKFAWQYNFDPEFIIVPLGQNELGAVRYLNYDDAEKFVNEVPFDQMPPSIFVAVRKVRKSVPPTPPKLSKKEKL